MAPSLKTCSALLLACTAMAPARDLRAEDLPALYAPLGTLVVTQLSTAPFPHPSRAEGHKYRDKLFPANEHYSDSTVALFIPRQFRETGSIDFVVHFHGWNNNVASVLRRYHLAEQLAGSGRNAVLVVPQGPRNASDSSGGKLEDPEGFRKFMEEVAVVLRGQPVLKRKDFHIGSIILSGHSGGYRVISAVLDRGGVSGQVREVWLFDALYAGTDKFLAWWDAQRGRLLNIYTRDGGTKEETENLLATLKKRGTPYWSGNEAEAKPGNLNANRPIFLFTALGHDEVLDKHKNFQQFLETSLLEGTSVLPP